MKHIVLFTSMMLVLAVSLSAQNEDVLRPYGRSGDASQGTQRTRSSSANPFIIGVEAGVYLDMFSQTLNREVPVAGSVEDVLAKGSGIGYTAGLFCDIPVAKGFGIQVRGVYDHHAFSNSSSSDTIDAVDTTSHTVFPMPVKSSYSWTSNNISLALLARIDLMTDLFLTVGPIASIRMGDAVRHDEISKVDDNMNSWITIDYDSVDGQYASISRDTKVATNISPVGSVTTSDYASARFGLELGIGYRLALSKTVYLAPNVRYQYMFTKLNDTFNATDKTRSTLQGISNVTYSNAMLNSLAIVLQLGITL